MLYNTFLTPVGLGGVCHIHAEGRDHITAGRFSVCLWTSGKVRIFQLLLFNGNTSELRST